MGRPKRCIKPSSPFQKFLTTTSTTSTTPDLSYKNYIISPIKDLACPLFTTTTSTTTTFAPPPTGNRDKSLACDGYVYISPVRGDGLVNYTPCLSDNVNRYVEHNDFICSSRLSDPQVLQGDGFLMYANSCGPKNPFPNAVTVFFLDNGYLKFFKSEDMTVQSFTLPNGAYLRSKRFVINQTQGALYNFNDDGIIKINLSTSSIAASTSTRFLYSYYYNYLPYDQSTNTVYSFETIGRFYKMDLDTFTLTTYNTTFINSTNAMEINGDGDTLYINDYYNSRLYQMSTDGSSRILIGSDTGFYYQNLHYDNSIRYISGSAGQLTVGNQWRASNSQNYYIQRGFDVWVFNQTSNAEVYRIILPYSDVPIVVNYSRMHMIRDSSNSKLIVFVDYYTYSESYRKLYIIDEENYDIAYNINIGYNSDYYSKHCGIYYR